MTQDQVRDTSRTSGTARSTLGRVWPAALGVLVAAGTMIGLADARDVAPVLAASGFVYLVAAALGRPGAAWPAFGVTFVLIGVAKVTDLDPTVWLLALALVLAVVGLARGRARPAWSLPLQAAAMLVLAAAALVAVRADATAGGLVVAVALLGHAAWDFHHHRTGRVVSLSLAEFCGVLDVLLAVALGVLVLTA
ncbi:hypothetical protein [Krasilnikoviella flava]|uniref:Uncharacterized protein n=1 Tax=Krasilnikoviella flava TaxID=526729 RepID=A0A1T5KTA8_9MICO|nr:hypothetical protein [Krasilnikoviella flava]SKC66705.1 hypothetical protein SAMN04324258_2355 [Krasilnikoviella flava]